jgi:glutaconate CoA-transferase subunit B
MYEIFAYYLQNGKIDVGFLGGAQIDRFGNINATVIGPYDKPKVRLPGSGGAAEIAAWANRIYCLTPHQARRFPERCDFVTSAGFLSGRQEREAKGLRGGGPQAVVTDLGLLEPDENGELILTALHASRGATVEIKNTGWKLRVADDLKTTSCPPTKNCPAQELIRRNLPATTVSVKARSTRCGEAIALDKETVSPLSGSP